MAAARMVVVRAAALAVLVAVVVRAAALAVLVAVMAVATGGGSGGESPNTGRSC